MTEPEFLRGNARIDRLRERPALAEAVAALGERADENDRVLAQGLAMIREASNLTQVELGRKLNVSQGAVSQLEGREDMLLSTLRGYLTATGARNPRIVVTVGDQEVELRL